MHFRGRENCTRATPSARRGRAYLGEAPQPPRGLNRPRQERKVLDLLQTWQGGSGRGLREATLRAFRMAFAAAFHASFFLCKLHRQELRVGLK